MVGNNGKWRSSIIAEPLLTFIEGWNSIFFENHDHPRSMVRFLNDDPRFRNKSAKMLATLHFSLRGMLPTADRDQN